MLVTFYQFKSNFLAARKAGLELNLQKTSFTLEVLPFRRIKKTNVQSLYWSFEFIDISPLTASTRSKIQKKNYFGFTNAFSKVHFRSTEGQTFYWPMMTVDDSIKRRCANSAWQAKWVVFKISGFVCKRFLLFFPTPSSLFYLRHFSRGLDSSWLILFP